MEEHIWLVALYEQELRASELLERLNAIGVDTSEATTVRVEIDDQMRAAKFSALNTTLPPLVRGAVSGALLCGTVALVGGIAFYSAGWWALTAVTGLFNHALLAVFIGALVGAVLGALLTALRQQQIARARLSKLPVPKSEGFLVAVKMPPPLAERAEEIARGLGAKEILL
jgi:hypothetical protein